MVGCPETAPARHVERRHAPGVRWPRVQRKGDTVRVRSEEHTELIELVRAWDESMIANDSRAIGSFMTEDWIIIGPDGSVDGRERLLGLIASGDLTHDTMSSEDLIIRVFGDSAIVVARGVSAGTYKGRPFREHERSSNFFVRRNGRWVCALTHLSSIPPGNLEDDAS